MALKLEQLRQAQYRHAQFYLHQLEALNRHYRQGGNHSTDAIHQFEALWAQIQQGQTWTAENRDDAQAAALCSTYPDAGAELLTIRQTLPERIRWLEQGLAAAEQIEHHSAAIYHRFRLASAYTDVGKLEHAIRYAEQAVDDAQAQGDTLTAARALMILGHAHHRLSNYNAARDCYTDCLKLARELNNPIGIATSLNNLGVLTARQGDYAASRAYYEESLALHRDSGSLDGIAGGLNNLGSSLWALGELAEARTCYAEAVAIRRQLGDISGLANALNNLGAITASLKQFTVGRDYLNKALKLATDNQQLQVVAYTLTNLGTAARDEGDYPAALDYYDQSHHILMEIGEPFGICDCELNIAFVHLLRKDTAAARNHLQTGLSIAHDKQITPMLLWAILGYAHLRLLANDAEHAARYAGLVNGQRVGMEYNVREHLKDLRAQLENHLSSDDLQTAFDAGASLDLETVIHELLNDFLL